MNGAKATFVEETLRREDRLSAGERVGRVEQLAGGWSRHSYIAQVEGSTPRRYVVRCKPAGALLDTDIRLEWDVLRFLQTRGEVRAPEVLGFSDAEENPFGGPLFLMAHIEGRVASIFSRADREWLLADWEGPRGIATGLVDDLARIHSIATDELPASLPRFAFAESVSRWREVYERRRLIRDPFIEEAFAWLGEHEPADAWPGLVHGDFRVGNAIVRDGAVVAILDWELAHVGDVRFDLGYLALERSAGKHLTRRSPLFAAVCDEEWFFDRYAERMGRRVRVEDLSAFRMLATMMVLGTQLTAASMYAAGETRDMRMAWSRFSFPGLRQDMARLMRW